MSTHKICSKCKQNLPLDKFQKDRSRPDGYMYHCRHCRLKFERVRRGCDPNAPLPTGAKFDRNAYKIANKDYYTAKSAERRARKMNATPKWLTSEHHKEIQEIYAEARSLGFHVDHVIPLQGKTVCGLHVPWNLQPLHPKLNGLKSNKLLI